MAIETITENELGESQWVPIHEAVKNLNVTERTLRNWGNRGKIRLARTERGKTVVDLASIPDDEQGAELMSAAVAMVSEARQGNREMFECYRSGLTELHHAFAREHENLREHVRALEKQLRASNKLNEELGDNAVTREITIDEHQRSERRWDLGMTAIMHMVAKRLGIDPAEFLRVTEALLPAEGKGDDEEESTRPEDESNGSSGGASAAGMASDE